MLFLGQIIKKTMKKLTYLTIVLLLIVSCNQKKKEIKVKVEEQVSTMDTTDIFPDLVPEEVFLDENSFGEIIELTGTPHPVENIFRVSESNLIATDSILIVKNPNEGNVFMTYSLPDFKLIKSFGLMGRGPNEFMFPSITRSNNEDYLCYIYQRFHDKLYSLDNNYSIKEIKIPTASNKKSYGDKQLRTLSDNHFIYAESTNNGKSIFDFQFDDDTLIKKEIYNLAFSSKHKNWAAYIGDFEANKDKNRAVFAYKKFKRLVFIDIEKGTKRIINFGVDEAKTGSVHDMLAEDNITHYWGMSAQDNYVYCLYSGRTPIEVHNQLKQSKGYIYVEQFDWNGNPIKKYKLNNWGYFCVNKSEDKIYLMSTTDADPFVTFDLVK